MKKLFLPAIVSFMGLIIGLCAIYLSMHVQFGMAAALILIAALLDACDGRVAKLSHGESEFGAHLDSLCDAVNFGIVPIIFTVNQFDVDIWMIAGSAVFLCAGIFRLARFGAQKKDNRSYFHGVPITVNGILFPALYVMNTDRMIYQMIFVVMGILMISTIKVPRIFR
jgi:CDP-diacylglycerol---serine O-phosphatidyltransferase